MLAIALVLALQPGPPTCRIADSRVQRLIESTVAESKGVEYCQFRMYHTIDDVDGDGREDFMVVFSVEAAAGGNEVKQFLAVFPSRTAYRPVKTVVGRRGQRSITDLCFSDGAIELETLEQRPGDAMCCPSGEGTTRYVLKEGALREIDGGASTAGRSE